MIFSHFSVQPLDLSHGGLDVETLHVLPVLLQQGDEEVHGEMDVLDKIVLSHTHVPNSNRQAEHLKQTMKKPALTNNKIYRQG